MKLEQIKYGKMVQYTTNMKRTGKGKVTEVKQTLRGVRVTVYDKELGREMTVHASHISAVPRKQVSQ